MEFMQVLSRLARVLLLVVQQFPGVVGARRDGAKNWGSEIVLQEGPTRAGPLFLSCSYSAEQVLTHLIPPPHVFCT